DGAPSDTILHRDARIAQFVTSSVDTSGAATIVPGMFRGPRRLAPLMPLLQRLPTPVARQVVVALTVGDGVTRIGRLRRALSFAAAQPSPRGKWSLAMRLLANHGRFVAEETMLGVSDAGMLRRDVVVHGAE